MHPHLASEIRAIAADNRHGAMWLARRAAAAVFETPPGSVEALRQAADAIESAQPAMEPLLRIASLLRETSPEGIRRTFSGLLERIGQSAALIAREAAPLFHPGTVVLTHSASETVAAAILANRPARAIVTESRPMREGVGLARSLAREGVAIDLIADAAAAVVMPEVALVLVGADALSPRGVVNKIGTRMIALAAREAAVPLYVLCSELKVTTRDPPEQPPRDPSELADLPGCRVRNYYFETVPQRLVTGIVTESGIRPAPSVE